MNFIKTIFFTLLFIVIGLNIWMVKSTKKHIYTSLDKIPYKKVGLVLGTSNRSRDGGKNSFFRERMITASQLFRAGKVDQLIVSGDNRSQYYNEPAMMQTALIEMGVPSEKILIDAGGYRTIESIKNAKHIFGLTSFTIITQEFHGYRALFISNYFSLDAQVMRTKKLPFKDTKTVHLRETFARIKAFIELYVLYKVKK